MKTAAIGDKPVNLNDNEEIIWQGRPQQGIIRNPAHIGVGLALLALGLWLTVSGVLLASLLVLSGGYLAYFHAIVEKNRRASTYYALTNQRVILAYSLRVLAYSVLPESRFTLKSGRYDTVLFSDSQHTGGPQGARLRGVGFGHLKNGEDVYNMMLSVQKTLAAKPRSTQNQDLDMARKIGMNRPVTDTASDHREDEFDLLRKMQRENR